MNHYTAIQDDVRARYGRTVKNCWIAHVKELNDLPLAKAPNRQSPSRRVYPCPDYARPWIEKSMRRVGMLPA
jgi:hypothetical protein